MNTQQYLKTRSRHMRRRPASRGAIVPLFAFLLPVLIVLCGFAVNIAYMQLTRTELRISTDAAARAAGRTFSEEQDVDLALANARSTAAMNLVGGAPLQIDINDNTGDVEFGVSTAQAGPNGEANGGRYVFTPRSTQSVRSQNQTASAIRITGRRNQGSLSGPISLFFNGFQEFSDFEPVMISVASQVDRDIALILDRSGSMAFHKDFTGDATGGSWPELFHWVDDQMDDYMEDGGEWYTNNRGRRRFRWLDPVLEAAYNSMDRYKSQLERYYYEGGSTPSNSRWDSLDAGVNAFLDVLDLTDQSEQVSLGSFNSQGRLDLQLQTNYQSVRNWVNNTRPTGGTAIHSGLSSAFGSLYTSLGRPYAAKTLVVLTDGNNNDGPQVIYNAVDAILASHNLVVHTVTFTPGADQTAMREVARRGGGKHFHANDTSGLIAIFEEIANNLPTLITQ